MVTNLTDKVKVVFFGTSEFAVPVLQKLADSNYKIAAVVTQPDKPAGQKQEPLPSPVKVAAQRLGLKIIQPNKLHPHSFSPYLQSKQGEMKEGVDLFIVASYGKIIPKEVLAIPKFGALNIHASLLPKYRGPSPIHAAILNGDEKTGVTIIKLDEKVDHGNIVANTKLETRNSKLGFKELHDKLAELGADLLIQILPRYTSGEVKPTPQDHTKATFTKLITKDDARIDWSKSAEEIDRLVRAYSQWPVAWTTLEGKRLKIYTASPLPRHPHSFSPYLRSKQGEMKRGSGEVANTGEGKILINTGSGLLEILSLQLEGGKRMPAKDFINGYPGLKSKILV